jgi:hypothetical protein
MLKKHELPEVDLASYRSISNLSVISKLPKRLVARQLAASVEALQLLPPCQSGCRRGHLTETAATKVLSDLLDAVDRGDTARLTLLDLSSAFDTVDRRILPDCLRVSFCLKDRAVDCFQSYLLGQTHQVRYGESSSIDVEIICGVPQWSVLCPLLFVIYTSDVKAVVSTFAVSLRQCADDSQLYGCCRPNNTSVLSAKMSDSTSAVACWMRANRLQLNADVTDLLWCASARRASRLPTSTTLIAGANIVISGS